MSWAARASGRRLVAAALLAVLAVLPACDKGAREPAIEVPARSPTAGDALLAVAPRGAQAILELDVARLRGNPVLGELAGALLPGREEAGAAGLALGEVDALVIASYELGGGKPRTVVLARGGDAAALAGAVVLRDGSVAIGDAELVRQSEAIAAGAGEPLTMDRRLMALRAAAMPPAADAATLRLTAALDLDARVALARRLEIDTVPVTISLWGDVVDDLAVIARLGGAKRGDGARLERAAAALVRRLGDGSVLYGRMLARELARTRIDASGAAVQLTLVIGPRRLAVLAGRARDALRTTPPATPAPDAAPDAAIDPEPPTAPEAP